MAFSIFVSGFTEMRLAAERCRLQPLPCRGTNAPFPLTPALSLWEREPLGAICRTEAALRLESDRPAVLPLPQGEGRGEGEGRVQLHKMQTTSVDDCRI